MSRLPTPVIVILPLALLAGLLASFYFYDPLEPLKAGFPPIEELTIQRLVLTPEGISAQVVNGGPEPVTIAQAQVDEAYWEHRVDPSRTLERLSHATVFIPYPWVEGEPHAVKLVTSTGLTFEKEIPVAVMTPTPSLGFVMIFAILGIYVGVLPVGLGLLWFPALRRTPDRWMDFFLFLTIGLLVFLGVDAVEEALEVTENIPGAYQGIGLLMIGLVGCFLLLTTLEKKVVGDRREISSALPLNLAYMVALGIGLHNLSEGLAIGAAYTLGNVALGTMLVTGFTLHNTTEGLAIVSPVARTDVSLRHLALLGAVGGVPTIFGAWIGGFVYSDVIALLFLAIGAGAIFQVACQIATHMSRRRGGISSLVNIHNFSGLLAGFLIMYATGLFVAM